MAEGLRRLIADHARRPTEKPRPLVPRHLRRGIRERVTADGTVERALDRAQAGGEVRALLGAGVESYAVCLHQAFRNPVLRVSVLLGMGRLEGV